MRQTYFQRLIAMGALTIMLAASIILYFAVDKFLERQTVQKFQTGTTATTEHITERMANYADLLHTAQALLVTKPDISNAEWRAFFDRQDTYNRYEGVSSVIYGTYFQGISHAEATTRTNAQAQTARPIKIKPSGDRSEYVVISLLSSHNNIQGLLGLDVLSNKERRTTLNAARTTTTPQISTPTVLASKVPGLFMHLPQYDTDDQLAGFIAIAFRSPQLAEQLVKELPDGTAIRIADTSKGATQEIYKSPDWGSHEELQRTDTVSIAGRSWDITYQAPVTAYQDLLTYVIPVSVLIFGLSISVLVFVIVVAIFRIRFSLFEHQT